MSLARLSAPAPAHDTKAVHDAKAAQQEEETKEAQQAQEAKEASGKEKEEAEKRDALDKEVQKQQEKAERKKNLDDAKAKQAKDPKFQALQWLSGLAKIIAEIEKYSKAAKTATRLPNRGGATYHACFEKHKVALLAGRSEVEAPTTKKELKPILESAKGKVEEAQRDLKAFKLLYKGYY